MGGAVGARGREVSTFLAGYQDRPLETDAGLTVSLRWFS
jgi:hypothetical protein